jgi:D-amino-acid dehydrogenase
LKLGNTEKGLGSDVIVLGAGIIGVCVALHLQARGKSVVLVDKGEPGGETSHGNAGLVERASVIPYAMPRSPLILLGYALNRSSAVRYAPSQLPRLLPWLARYWWHSGPARLAEAARDMLPLIEACVREHEALIGPAGAGDLMRSDGWIELYSTHMAWEQAARDATALIAQGLSHDVLDRAAMREREPCVSNIAGGIHWHDPMTSSDPGAVTRAYARLFADRGGSIIKDDAMTLSKQGDHWTLGGKGAQHRAADAVIALGPWSADLCARFGYRFPLAYKRGYHMHYAVKGPHALIRPVCDSEAGFVLSPMRRGVRLTTGVELAGRDTPSDTRQLKQAERIARRYVPLGDPLDAEPWRGSRPCLPDMKPVIGRAQNHDTLWFAFGHAHHGFTLGPVTGRLLAEVMTGTAPFTDPSPYGPARFGR